MQAAPGSGCQLVGSSKFVMMKFTTPDASQPTARPSASWKRCHHHDRIFERSPDARCLMVSVTGRYVGHDVGGSNLSALLLQVLDVHPVSYTHLTLPTILLV
eukprot:414879-Amphidinium_carterae.1